jgi:hypothetical protein
MVLPIAAALPALAFAQFGPCGPTTGWSLTLLTIAAFYCEIRAIRLFLKGMPGEKDLLWFLRFPLSLFSVGVLLVDTFVFLLMALPALLFGDLPNIAARLHG